MYLEDEFKDDEEGEMDDFIVNDEIVITVENAAPLRQRKFKETSQTHPLRVTLSVLEDHRVFGDVDELLKLRKQYREARHKSNDMDDFDMDKNDDLVHEIDMYEGIGGHDRIGNQQIMLEEESSWMLNQLHTNMFPFSRVKERSDETSNLVDQIDEQDIVRFLKLHYVEKYDIPFIAMYRKEQCRSLLTNMQQDGIGNADENNLDGTNRLKWHKILWAIKELHKKLMLLQNRKVVLLQNYFKHNEEEIKLKHQLFESVITSLRNAESEKDIDDADMKFSLHFPPVESGADAGSFRRPKWRLHYDNCIKAGLWDVARKFGIDPQRFGTLFTLEESWSNESPEKVASNFTCSMFETPEAVLKGARHMVALEISCEPRIKRHIRRFFSDKAVVSTSPTTEGNKVMDCFHRYAKIKWIHEKPLLQFFDAQWLLIQKAEEEKLLQVTIKLQENTLINLRSHFCDCYIGDGLNGTGQLWNEQRRFILEDALSNYLLPCMEKEARNLLTTRAKNWLLFEYGKQLWKRVSVAPYKREGNNVGASNVKIAPRVMACCWGPGKPETTFVMLDSAGEVLDVLHAGYLSSRTQNLHDQQCRKSDRQSLLKLLRNHQPHVVVLGADNLFSTRLKDDISEIIHQMEEKSEDVGQALVRTNIVYGDASLPHLYEHSQTSSEQLPGKPGIVKLAIALGRYLQNPLAMVATLCDARREIVKWKLTSLDHFLSSDEKYMMIEQVMVDVTNQVGFDINLVLNHEWLYPPLQFISGLGSQKAAEVKNALVSAIELTNRKQLTDCGLRENDIFRNAVGFLRVRSGNTMDINSDINALDDTRIHPESYCLAEDFAKYVHKFYDRDDIFPIHNLRTNPNLLNGFNAKAYLKEKGENRVETIYDIIAEFKNGFHDPRKVYKEPTHDEVFDMIFGGYKDMLAEGRIVRVTIRHVLAKKAICMLEAGLTGILSKDDFSDQGAEFNLKDRLHEGDSLACKIKQIDKSKYMVFLSYKENELKSKPIHDFHHSDPYYRESCSNSISLQDIPHKEKELTDKHFTSRTIFHHKFHNMTTNEATKFLSDKDVGEYMFRPNLRGVYYLTLTVKVYNELYAHKDIIEDEKDQSDLAALLCLGGLLKIGDDEFGNLYEVQERYIDPLVTNLKAMLGYRKFRAGSNADVINILRAEKAHYPTRITFNFSICHKHPGTFILSYIRSINPHHEYVGLHPKGFMFRKHIFDNIDLLVVYFQKCIEGLQNSRMAIVTGPHSRVSCRHTSLSFDRGRYKFQFDKDKTLLPYFRGKTDEHAFPWPYGGFGGGSHNDKGSIIGKEMKDLCYGTKFSGFKSKNRLEGNIGFKFGGAATGGQEDSGQGRERDHGRGQKSFGRSSLWDDQGSENDGSGNWVSSNKGAGKDTGFGIWNGSGGGGRGNASGNSCGNGRGGNGRGGNSRGNGRGGNGRGRGNDRGGNGRERGNDRGGNSRGRGNAGGGNIRGRGISNGGSSHGRENASCGSSRGRGNCNGGSSLGRGNCNGGSSRGRGNSNGGSSRGRGNSNGGSSRGRGNSNGGSSRGRGNSNGGSSRGRGNSNGGSSRGRGNSNGGSSRGRENASCGYNRGRGNARVGGGDGNSNGHGQGSWG